jgi:hypothetical protein
MRNMRSISIGMRNIISNFSALLLLLLGIGLSELDEFLIFSVHPRVVLVTHLVVNAILDMRHSYIKYVLFAYLIFSSSMPFCCLLRG